MPDRKRISIHADEFDAHNDARGDLPWTAYLRKLREFDAEPEIVRLTDEDKREIAQRTADEIEARLGER